MTDNRSLLKLMSEQREDLQRWAQSRTLPAGDVFRARLILALADGSTYRDIARSLKTSLPTIARWKMRFERDGLAGWKAVIWAASRGQRRRRCKPA
jgi:putative transposase